MALSTKQIMALSDANSEINRTGLEKCGAKWFGSFENSFGHHNTTIQSLVNRGYLQLYVKQTVAHITDRGIEVLTEEIND